ncbi:unnamed protein product [Coregonus sp. 'balchen']|nr:unnamed protein product [Coregonus sp. 'balchen']
MNEPTHIHPALSAACPWLGFTYPPSLQPLVPWATLPSQFLTAGVDQRTDDHHVGTPQSPAPVPGTKHSSKFLYRSECAHAEPHEMNKAPQPITGSPSVPHPASSPGLQLPTFPPGQPPSVVFATPPPQMNPAPQPRQLCPVLYTNRSLQPYYSRPSNAPLVPPNSTPRTVAPTHVYQPGQQMMIIPSQQIPFPNQQGPAYFIPGQYRSTYVATPQQYPVPPGTPGFYPGTSPAEYGTYGFWLRPRPGGREVNVSSGPAQPTAAASSLAGATGLGADALEDAVEMGNRASRMSSQQSEGNYMLLSG